MAKTRAASPKDWLERRRGIPLLPARSVALEKDKWGNWVINKQYNAAMLAEALCKLEGFTYAPSDTSTGSMATPPSGLHLRHDGQTSPTSSSSS